MSAFDKVQPKKSKNQKDKKGIWRIGTRRRTRYKHRNSKWIDFEEETDDNDYENNEEEDEEEEEEDGVVIGENIEESGHRTSYDDLMKNLWI